MIILKIIAFLFVFILTAATILYKVYVMLSNRYEKSERIATAVELAFIASFVFLMLG